MTDQENPTVLLVDDEDAIRAGLAAALDRTGFRVLEARDGPEALKMVEAHAPDVIVLDILMPEMDGPDGAHADQRPPAPGARDPARLAGRRSGGPVEQGLRRAGTSDEPALGAVLRAFAITPTESRPSRLSPGRTSA